MMSGAFTSSLLVQINRGQAVTNSVVIAEEFGRRHDNVLNALDLLITEGVLNRLEFKEIEYLDSKRRRQRAIELSERGALIAMPFIGGRKSRQGQVRLVDAFLTIRSALHSECAGWLALRKSVSVGYRIMSDALHEVRMDDGKITRPHHYANEARMLNGVLFGTFAAVNRECLSPSDLALLEALETRNAILIARGRTYEERKAALAHYLDSLRSPSLEYVE